MEVRRPEFDGARAMMSAADDERAGSAIEASRVGAELRMARLRLGWSLEEVAQALRIRLPFMVAIEEGRVGDLPGAAYAVGFVRTYSQTLGLDPDEVSRRFRAEAHEVNRKTELTFPAPVPERGVPAGAVVLLGLVLVVGGYAGWYKFSSVRHPDTAVPAVPDRLAPLAERAPASNVLSQVTPVLPPATLNPAAEPSSSTAGSAGSGSGSAGSGISSASAAPVSAIPVPVPVPVTLTPSAPPPDAPAEPAADATRVVLKFRADSYIQVREKQGPVLLNRVMRAGETWPVPKEPNLVMTTGNAGGTDIVVDGVTAAPIGGNGAVKRDISLAPEAIKLPPGAKLPPQRSSQ